MTPLDDERLRVRLISISIGAPGCVKLIFQIAQVAEQPIAHRSIYG
jgi:hypothetical protein